MLIIIYTFTSILAEAKALMVHLIKKLASLKHQGRFISVITTTTTLLAAA